ncbi:LANO_0H24388g1_1 [Lachancea nothofagi CBS 11611]|uniref:LANO_0H24388g1_1 n=1 Tax=Lachancea nothofagi CBS 11611 TaxID=1266666 RepID=A0A1G4KP00_9SACH|nr:LANO_0H24388g1_1 [Lachancea nothofagi CBS 11611]
MTTEKMEVDSVPAVDPKQESQTTVDQILGLLQDVSKTTTSLDSRFVWKATRELSVFRPKLDKESLSIAVNLLYPDNSAFKISLLKYINNNQKSRVENADKERQKYPAAFYQLTSVNNTVDVSAEVNSFVHLLVQLYLLDSQQVDALDSFNTLVVLPKVLKFYNQRSLDLINAKLWFYVCRAREMGGNSFDTTIRAEMIKFLKTATLKHDNETRGMLVTFILRSFLQTGEVDTAADFISKVEFPGSNDVSSPLEARHFYYLSKLNAIQLDYSTANDYVIAAIRKAPNTKKCLGFLQQANKLHCVIELLMGDIPELSFFKQKDMERSLLPYYHLSKAVKLGDLNKFTSAISTYKKELLNDGNYQLCVRLRSSVIKTGIRIISLTYKKISLKDICLKLRLDSEQTVEYMVSRAIRDGVIEAKINHEEGYIESSELLNVYATDQPQQLFDERIRFVNQLHDECVKAMRYPEDGNNKDKNKPAGDYDQMEEMIDLADLDEDDLGDLGDFY